MKPKKNFNAKRAPVGQLHVRIDKASRYIVSSIAHGDIKKVNIGMVREAAAHQNLPLEEIVEHLRKLGANI